MVVLSRCLKFALAFVILSATALAIAEDKPRLILLTVKGEGVDRAVKSNIRVAIEQELSARYTVFSGSQVDKEIEREFVKQCRIYYDDAEMANSECMKEVAGFFVADYIATPQISAQAGGYLLTLEIRDAYTSQSFDPYSDNCIDCSILELADAFRAMIANKNRAAGLGAPFFIEASGAGGGGSSSVVDLTTPVKPQDRGQVAVLLFDSVPSGAEVWLGDIKAGTTPYQNLQLSSGQNLNITLRAQDYRDLQVALTLQPGSNTPKPFELVPAFGSLSITSEPSGADVYISGELVGQTPYSSSRLASAKYLVDIRKPLYFPLSNQTIAIEDGQRTERSFKLEPNFGDLSVASEPPAATITLEANGREVYRGSTPISLQLEPATYILSARKAGYAERRFEVTIARGDRTSIDKEQLQLRQLLGTAIISSEPTSPGARVLIDGKDAGTVPLITELPVGSYEVTIKSDPLQGTANLQIRDGEQHTLLVELGEAVTSTSIPAILWWQKIGINSWRNTPVIIGEHLYVGSSGSSWNKPDALDGIYAFEAKTGKRKWFYQSAIDVNEVAFIEGLILVGNDLGEVFAISAASGKLRWKIKVRGAVYAKPAYSDVGVVIATGKGNLYLLNLNDGNIIDETTVDGGVRAGLVMRDSHVYVATESGTIYHFAVSGGFSSRGKVSLIYPDKYGSNIGYVDESISRFSQLGNGRYSEPSIYSSPLLLDDKMIIGFVRDTYYSYPAVLAFNLMSDGSIGELSWYGTDAEELVGAFGNIRFTPAYYEGYLYFGNPYSNEVYALNAADGKVVWGTELGQPMFQHWPSPVIGTNFLYVARHDGYLHKIDPKTGVRLSSIFLGLHERAGLVFDHNEALPGKDLGYRWNPSGSFSIFSTPAYSRGVVFVGSDEGYLYAIGM